MIWTLGPENNFYKSAEWRKLIEVLKLKRANPQDGIVYCEHCGKPILRKYDLIAHHVIELTEENVNDTSISLNEDNIQLVCFDCHNRIHERFNYARKQVYIVYGAPFAGKTSYIKEVAGADDIICEIDRIYQCISINSRYNKSNKLKSNVFDIRDLILEQIRLRRGKWNNAYVIAGLPSKGERERLINKLNAREVFIDTDKDTCITRALEQFGSKEKASVYLGYIDDWFDDYIE